MRVVTWLLIDVDIPLLSYDGIQSLDFSNTYSLQSSSNHSPISSSFDATALEYYISFEGKTPSSTIHVVRNREELNSIPLDVKDLWIGRIDTTGLTELSFNRYQSLKSLVIGNSVYCASTRFDLSNFPQLQSVKLGDRSFQYSSFKLSNLTSLKSIDIGRECFRYAPSFSLIGMID